MTEQEQYQQYLKEQQDQAEYEEYLASQVQSQPEVESSMGDVALRGLDYERIGGAAALAKALSQYDKSEFTKALKMQGNIPSSQELYERAGLADKGSTLGFIGGVATDIATSPSTYASFGSSAILKNFPKVARLLESTKWANPVGELASQGASALTKGAGKKIYNSAFSKLDNVAKSAGTEFVPSDLLRQANVKGWKSSTIADNINKTILDYENQRKLLISGAQEPFDEKSFMQPILEKIKELGTSPLPEDKVRAAELGKWATETINNIRSKGSMTAEETNLLRQRIDKNMPSMYSGVSTAEKEIGQAKAAGARAETAKMTQAPTLFNELGQKENTLITALKPQESLVRSEIGKVSPVEVAATISNPKMMALRSLARSGLAQGPKTMVGSSLEATSDFLKQNPWLISLPVRQSFVSEPNE